MNTEIKQMRAALSKQTNRVNNLTQQLSKVSVQKPSSQTVSQRTLRNRRRRNKRRQITGQTLDAPTSINSAFRKNRLTARGGTSVKSLGGQDLGALTNFGESFLKCAFAPPDFGFNDLSGVPDQTSSPSLAKKHKSVNTLALVGGNDYYILLLPTPGIAYWIFSVAAGTPVLAATGMGSVNYSDFVAMFINPASTTTNVTRFRYVSNHIEVIPTTNEMAWSGAISAFKIPVSMIIRQGGVDASDLWSIEGLSALNAANANQYTGPYKNGYYGGAYSSNCDFQYNNILENVANLPNVLGAADFGRLTPTVAVPGFDNGFESLVVKISGVTANESIIIKTWACVEYLPAPGSMIYEFASHAGHDPAALELYRRVIASLPIGVTYMDNESFWNRVLSVMSRITGATALIPGPIGGVSRGLNLISNTLLPFTNR